MLEDFLVITAKELFTAVCISQSYHKNKGSRVFQFTL